MKMEAVLKLKGVWPAVRDGIAADDAAVAVKKKEMDDKARSLIVLGVSDHHLSMLADCATAKACWEALHNIYRAKTVARRQQLRREMNRLQKDPRDTIVVYVDKSRRLWQELVATGLDMKESELVWCLLAGLPAEFNTMVEIIEGKYDKSDDISLSEVLPQLLQVEQRHAQKESQTTTQALFTRSGGNSGNGGNNARTGNNWRSGNSGGGGPGSSNFRGVLICFFCGKEGHMQADCAEYKMARDRARRPTALMATVGDSASSYDSVSKWTVDSGATRHVSPYRSLFLDVRRLASPVTVTFGNGQSAVAAGEGEVLLSTLVGGAPSEVVLHNVLWVPDATTNLLSVQQAVHRGASVMFGGRECAISVRGQVVAVAQESGGLYCLTSTACNITEERAHLAKVAETAELWHRRYAHVGYHSLADLVKHDMVSGISTTSAADFLACRWSPPDRR